MRIQLGWFDDKTAARVADIEAGRIVPAVPRDAATVMVLRPAAPRAGETAATHDASGIGVGVAAGAVPGAGEKAGSGPRAGETAGSRPRAAGSAAGAAGAAAGAHAAAGTSVDAAAGTLADAAAGTAVRGGAAGVEVLMLRRTAAMKFAPGAYVFPGGAVDQADYAAEVGWQGPSAADFGARLGAAPDVARALVCAAVRETFEESGVLLAGEPGGGPLAVPSGAAWEADRAAMTSGALTLAGLLAKRGLVLRADLLVPWARWVAPEGEPRRFDARFFAAALPEGQQAVGHEAESDRVEWLSPAAAIAAAKAGEISLFPPTAATLNDFASASAAGDGLTDILAVRRTITPVQPRLVLDDGAAWLELPDEAGYPL